MQNVSNKSLIEDEALEIFMEYMSYSKEGLNSSYMLKCSQAESGGPNGVPGFIISEYIKIESSFFIGASIS